MSESMSSGPPSVDTEHRRKRIRKGTKSCWECKRRKIKCQLSSEDVPVCSGCLVRGTHCLSQEYPEERELSNSGSHVGERLGRVEHLLEILVAKVSAYEEEERILTPESMSTDLLSPNDGSANAVIRMSAPLMSLLDNTTLGRRENDQSQAPTPSSLSTKSPSSGGCPVRQSKTDRIRQTLVELLPSQRDTDLIANASSSWLLIHALASQSPLTASIFDLAKVAKTHPVSIARTLLYLAVCLQQLHQDFDSTQLKLYPSTDARMEKYISTVQALITSDDDLCGTMEGLECLILQGVFHINAGNPRRAWLNFKKAMNIGQLMGIHRKSSTIPGGRAMWQQTIQADRYLALLLGLPAGSDDVGFGPEETFQNPEMDKDKLFVRKLCDISGRIIARNQSEQTQAYGTTQGIDETFESLAKEMPDVWWKIPDHILHDRSEASAVLFDQMMTQIWYYQLVALVHLPFMLRAATERRYEYSRFSCLKASREILHRYLVLRKTHKTSFCCKVIDFGAFTATVTLYIGLLEPTLGTESRDQKEQRESDRDLVNKVLISMEELSNGGKDLTATQSADAIRSLLAVDSGSSPHASNLKLAIPYFGTITIVRPPPTPAPMTASNPPPQYMSSPQPLSQVTAPYPWQPEYGNDPNTNFPLISFTSSQFPQLTPEMMSGEMWQMPEADTMFYDSLLEQDISGNWVF